MQAQVETRQSRIVINGFLNLSDDEKRQVINHIVDHRKHTYAEQKADRTNSRKMISMETEPIVPHCPCCGK
jgi:hypothetical protein